MSVKKTAPSHRTITIGTRVVMVQVSGWFPAMIGVTWLVVWGCLVYFDAITRADTLPAQVFISSLIGTVLVLGSVVVHEAAHVVAAECVGHRCTLLHLGGMGVAVGIDPEDPRGWHRITRSLAGPLAQILVCMPLLMPFFSEPLFFGQPWALVPLQHATWWLPGFLGAGVGLLNLVPLKPLDGAKILSGIRDLRQQFRPH